MVRKLFIFICVIFCSGFYLPENTLIDVKYHPDKIHCVHKNRNIQCAQNKSGGVILRCAKDKNINCANRHLKIDIFSTNREIEMHDDLPKRSCEYQEVLDHQLTRMNLHTDDLESIAKEGMENIVDAFDATFHDGSDCQEAVNAAQHEFYQFSERYQCEDKRVNYLFDRNDMDSVIQNCKTPPKGQIVYDPPPIDYSSVSHVECSSGRQPCVPEKGKKMCKKTSLICTDMAIDYRIEIKSYLAFEKIYVNVPEIKTSIFNRYSKNFCEYAVLKDNELSFVERVENARDHLVDTAPPYVAAVYEKALFKKLSG